MIKEYIIVQITNVGMIDRMMSYISKEVNMPEYVSRLKELLSPDEIRGIFSDEQKALSVMEQIINMADRRTGYFSIITVYSSSTPTPSEKETISFKQQPSWQ